MVVYIVMCAGSDDMYEHARFTSEEKAIECAKICARNRTGSVYVVKQTTEKIWYN